MPARIVDASVLAAVVFNEPRFAEAVSLLEGAELHAPTLLAYELTSVARKKVLLYPQLAREIGSGLADALRAEINWNEVDHRRVMDLALATGLTTYDASYLYLALSMNASIATFDEALRSAAV